MINITRGMKVRGALTMIAIGAAVVASQTGVANAGDQVLGTVVGVGAAPLPQLTKHGKIIIKPSTKAGDGAITIQLILSGVDCPPNNDGGAAGKCGVKGTPQTDHVLSQGAIFGGVFMDEVAGAKFKIEKGKAAFHATGKNKVGGATLFGAIVSAIYDTPLGLGPFRIRVPGTDPAACDSVPLIPGSLCTNGALYGVMGIVGGNDSGVSCANNTECSLSNICNAGVCQPEPCTLDADCDQNGTGNGGTGQCGNGGKCCDPALDPTCAGQVP